MGAVAASSPSWQAAPYPRRSARITVAPRAAAISGEPSREPLWTTSGRNPAGILLSTQGKAAASSRQGRSTSQLLSLDAGPTFDNVAIDENGGGSRTLSDRLRRGSGRCQPSVTGIGSRTGFLAVPSRGGCHHAAGASEVVAELQQHPPVYCRHISDRPGARHRHRHSDCHRPAQPLSV